MKANYERETREGVIINKRAKVPGCLERMPKWQQEQIIKYAADQAAEEAIYQLNRQSAWIAHYAMMIVMLALNERDNYGARRMMKVIELAEMINVDCLNRYGDVAYDAIRARLEQLGVDPDRIRLTVCSELNDGESFENTFYEDNVNHFTQAGEKK